MLKEVMQPTPAPIKIQPKVAQAQELTISVVIPVYNDLRIYKALESVLWQRNCKIELIVMDGGSKQPTLDVINRYRDHIDIFVSEPDKGIFDAINKGIQRATGDVIIALGADDRFDHPDVFAQVTKLMVEQPQLDGCFGDMVLVNDEDKVVRYWRNSDYHPLKLYFGWICPHFTLFLRRAVYEKCGLFNQTEYPITADFDFIMRILVKYKVKLGRIDDVLLRMTLGGNSNKSLQKVIKGNLESIDSCKKQFHLPYVVHFFKLLRKANQLVAAKFYQDNTYRPPELA